MKAVVLLSGGMDSAATLYYVKSKGYKIHALSFDYGQRHKKEIALARKLAKNVKADWNLLKISLPWRGSSLLDKNIRLPEKRKKGIPNTYVPSRNIIFLSYAVSYAEAIGADKVFIGANQIDYSGYPDCRASFLKSFATTVKKGTKRGVEGRPVKIEAPFIRKSKQEIIKTAMDLGVPLEYTWSCYKGAQVPCGECDSCLIRRKGFKKAGIKDPIIK